MRCLATTALRGVTVAALTACALVSFGPLAGTAAAAGDPTYPVPINSTTTLVLSPHPAVTNQTVTLTAVVSSSSSLFPPSGTVTFLRGSDPLSGCANEPLTAQGQSTSVTCQVSFAATSSPEHLRAVFTPTSGSGMSGSSDSATLDVDRGSTSVGITGPGGAVTVGKPITYTAAVDASAGPASPTGSVAFFEGTKLVGSCSSRPLSAGAATCTLRFRTLGRHAITAVYEGDGNFLPSPASPTRSVRVLARGTISSTMQWTFAFTPAYTRILALSVFEAPVGATILMKCHGTGCPFARRSKHVKRCTKTAKHKCNAQGSSTLALTAMFHRRRLHVGAGVTIEIRRSGWIGKYYLFKVRAGRGPKIKISCIAPGESVPGRRC